MTDAADAARKRLHHDIAALISKARQNPGDPDLWTRLGGLLWQAQHQEQALEAWQHATDAHLAAGHAARARAVLLGALHMAPYNSALLRSATDLLDRHPGPPTESPPPPPLPPPDLATARLVAWAIRDAGAMDGGRLLESIMEQAQADHEWDVFMQAGRELLGVGTMRVDLVRGYGQRALEEGDAEEAAGALGACLEMAPLDRGVRAALADAYLQLGMDGEARELLDTPRRRRRREEP